jgi:Protein of unknown function (DUF3224)
MKGDSMMRKLSLPLVCIAVLLSTFLIPVAYAKQPEPVSGTWLYLPYSITLITNPGGNQFKSGDEDGWWSGDFEGVSDDHFEVVAHPAGFVTCQGQINFVGMVNGESGTMTIHFVGKKEAGLWSGTWVILSGTDGLVNLHGEGTWGGAGFLGGQNPVPGILTYSGMIH